MNGVVVLCSKTGSLLYGQAYAKDFGLPAEHGGGGGGRPVDELNLAAMLFALLPQMLFFVWFVPVVLIWFHQSVFVCRKSYPLFRIGIWLGLGASSGIYLGSILAFNSF